MAKRTLGRGLPHDRGLRTLLVNSDPQGLAAVTAAAGLVPVRIAPEVPAVRETKDEPSAAPAPPESTLGSGASLGLVEIVLGNGRVLRVAERIDPAVLARLAAALDRR